MDTSKLVPFDEVVYQATKEIFVHDKAKTRKLEAVTRYLDTHPGDRKSVLKLITKYGGKAVHQSILRLLSHEMYESNMIATQGFPNLSEPSVVQSEGGALLEKKATTTEQATFEDTAKAHRNDCQEGSDSTETTMVPNVVNRSIAENEVDSSSVLPVYLPFPAEHMLMEKLQRILELACYQFGSRALPNVMQRQGWDCPESIELSEWVKLVGREKDVVWEGSGELTEDLLQSIAAIRHAAVHRLRTNSAGLEQFLADAERLAAVLGDDTFTQAISQLRLDTHATLTELIQKKQSTQLQLQKAQEEIARQRAGLDQKEQEVLRGMTSQDKRYGDLAGERLERVLHLMGDLRVTSDHQGVVLESVNDIEHEALSDDHSDFDDEEQFEDCSEA